MRANGKLRAVKSSAGRNGHRWPLMGGERILRLTVFLAQRSTHITGLSFVTKHRYIPLMPFGPAAMAASLPPLSDAAYYNPTNCPVAAKLCSTLHAVSALGNSITAEKVLRHLLSDLHGTISAASPQAPALTTLPGTLQNNDEWAKDQLSLHFPSVLSNTKACREANSMFGYALLPYIRSRNHLRKLAARGRDGPMPCKKTALNHALPPGNWAEPPQFSAHVWNAAGKHGSRPVVGGELLGLDPSPTTGAGVDFGHYKPGSSYHAPDQYGSAMVPRGLSSQNLLPASFGSACRASENFGRHNPGSSDNAFDQYGSAVVPLGLSSENFLPDSGSACPPSSCGSIFANALGTKNHISANGNRSPEDITNPDHQEAATTVRGGSMANQFFPAIHDTRAVRELGNSDQDDTDELAALAFDPGHAAPHQSPEIGLAELEDLDTSAGKEHNRQEIKHALRSNTCFNAIYLHNSRSQISTPESVVSTRSRLGSLSTLFSPFLTGGLCSSEIDETIIAHASASASALPPLSRSTVDISASKRDACLKPPNSISHFIVSFPFFPQAEIQLHHICATISRFPSARRFSYIKPNFPVPTPPRRTHHRHQLTMQPQQNPQQSSKQAAQPPPPNPQSPLAPPQQQQHQQGKGNIRLLDQVTRQYEEALSKALNLNAKRAFFASVRRLPSSRNDLKLIFWHTLERLSRMLHSWYFLVIFYIVVAGLGGLSLSWILVKVTVGLCGTHTVAHGSHLFSSWILRRPELDLCDSIKVFSEGLNPYFFPSVVTTSGAEGGGSNNSTGLRAYRVDTDLLLSLSVKHYASLTHLGPQIIDLCALVNTAAIHSHTIYAWVHANPHIFAKHPALVQKVDDVKQQLGEHSELLDSFRISLEHHLIDGRQRAQALHRAATSCLENNKSHWESTRIFMRLLYKFFPPLHAETDDAQVERAISRFLHNFGPKVEKDYRVSDTLRSQAQQIQYELEDFAVLLDTSSMFEKRCVPRSLISQLLSMPWTWFSSSPIPCLSVDDYLKGQLTLLREEASNASKTVHTVWELHKGVRGQLDHIKTQVHREKCREKREKEDGESEHMQVTSDGFLGSMERILPKIERLLKVGAGK
ncbi:uncharacterized protein MYCFIDRAFT_180472 [Pseudocercospora fijiensis CIRAD86]|uniref:Uncharacterized protein n=1 Tax=Pseudocercospora fijiensis (strain CIRAD86) TaxID=383855 RepID=M3AHJ8_PSEFD|nr:uncharacterized protein MYCFIDRAFT_180472 [Pseudocercospora fijiensis CIRAD86]EME76987.1 hypothetical protein MYCFIDRAFT_180472 [Pseudocercospora fijiensis CIRAD86]